MQQSQLPPSFSPALVPSGYAVDETGTYRQSRDGLVRIASGPCYVSALGREPSGTGWALKIHIITPDGKEQVLEAPFSSLSGSGLASLIPLIAEYGVLPLGGDKWLRDYLSECACQSNLPRLTLIGRLGFFELPSGAIGFALPRQIILGDSAGVDDGTRQTIAFRARNDGPVLGAYTAAGELKEWRSVVRKLRWSALHVFSICVGLAGPFLALAGVENGGINLHGSSSSGKTTALQLAASNWGRGADTQRSGEQPTVVERWNSTQNAFELLAAIHSGLLLIVDELGSGIDQNVYNLIGGKGKGRMTEVGTQRETRTWSIFLFSCGESSMQAHIESTQRRKYRTGEAVRVLDVPTDGLPEDGIVAPDKKRRAIEAAKEACGRVYGVAGPAFIQLVLNTIPSDELTGEITGQVDQAWQELLDTAESSLGRQLKSPQRRALRRLALVRVIGVWACGKILPFTERRVVWAVDAILNAWLSDQSVLSEGERAIQQLRDYVITHTALFLNVKDHEKSPGFYPSVSQGIVHKNKLLLTEKQLECVLDGLPKSAALSAMQQAGILHQTEERNRKTKHTITGLGISGQRFYTFHLGKLLAEVGEVVEGNGLDAEAENKNADNVTAFSSYQPPRRGSVIAGNQGS